MEAYIFKNSYVYEIQYAGMENKDYINIYNKILSTFKFTK